MQRLLLRDEEVHQRRINPSRIEPLRAELEVPGAAWIQLLRHRVLASKLIASLANSYPRFAHAQTSADQVRLACALERYRRAKGQYPDSLVALVPDWLGAVPNDVISGEPMRYRRTEAGRFLLWSVGWDAQDNGGQGSKGLAGPDWPWEPVAK